MFAQTCRLIIFTTLLASGCGRINQDPTEGSWHIEANAFKQQFPNGIPIVALRSHRSDGAHFCTGFLLSNGRIMTAAHCLGLGESTGLGVGIIGMTAFIHNLNGPGWTSTNITHAAIMEKDHHRSDWALLEHDQMRTLGHGLSLMTGLYTQVEMNPEMNVAVYSYDPPDAKSVVHTRRNNARLSLSWLSEGLNLRCRESLDRKHCFDGQLQARRFMSLECDDCSFVKGNSGSPVLFNNEVVGLLYRSSGKGRATIMMAPYMASKVKGAVFDRDLLQ